MTTKVAIINKDGDTQVFDAPDGVVVDLQTEWNGDRFVEVSFRYTGGTTYEAEKVDLHTRQTVLGVPEPVRTPLEYLEAAYEAGVPVDFEDLRVGDVYAFQENPGEGRSIRFHARGVTDTYRREVFVGVRRLSPPQEETLPVDRGVRFRAEKRNAVRVVLQEWMTAGSEMVVNLETGDIRSRKGFGDRYVVREVLG